MGGEVSHTTIPLLHVGRTLVGKSARSDPKAYQQPAPGACVVEFEFYSFSTCRQIYSSRDCVSFSLETRLLIPQRVKNEIPHSLRTFGMTDYGMAGVLPAFIPTQGSEDPSAANGPVGISFSALGSCG